MITIPLMKNAFLNEEETKIELANFVLNSSKFSMGEKCKEFEMKFGEWQKTKHSILFNSGASANLAILQSLKNLGKLKTGDNVAFSALTWSTNVMPIIQLGLIPVALDCDINNLNVTSKTILERLKTEEIKALFITNVLGFIGDLDEIAKLCNEKNILLLEDNCESLGTIHNKGTMTGNFGLSSSFSFFVAHHMSTIEGGMVCTNDDDFAEMLTIVRANGWDRNLTEEQQSKWRTKYSIDSELQAKYTFYDLAYNFRPTEITGFLGLTQLKFLDSNITKREANYYLVEKSIISNPDFIHLNHNHIKRLSTFAIPVVCKTKEIKNFYIDKFIAAGIEIRPMIAGNIQKQPFYTKYVKNNFDLINTDLIHDCGFYCGNYPELKDNELDIIKNCLTK
jgi:CDP-6-deoxy-D-xylo-4-hexulose-3-dehydrase